MTFRREMPARPPVMTRRVEASRNKFSPSNIPAEIRTLGVAVGARVAVGRVPPPEEVGWGAEVGTDVGATVGLQITVTLSQIGPKVAS